MSINLLNDSIRSNWYTFQYEKQVDIICNRFSPAAWNNYAFQVSRLDSLYPNVKENGTFLADCIKLELKLVLEAVKRK